MYLLTGQNGATCKYKGKISKSRKFDTAADVAIFLLGRKLSDWEIRKKNLKVFIPKGMCDIKQIADFLDSTV